MFGAFPFGGGPFGGTGLASPTMTLVEGLRWFLVNTPAITALTTTKNLFPMQGQQASQAPRVIYHRETEEDDDTVEKGETNSPTATIRLDCYGGIWGGGYKSARTLADAVLNADGGLGGQTLTHGFRGTWGLVTILSSRCTGDIDQKADPNDATGRGEQWVELTFSVAYLKQV